MPAAVRSTALQAARRAAWSAAHCQVARAVPQCHTRAVSQCDCRRERPLVQAWTQGTQQPYPHTLYPGIPWGMEYHAVEFMFCLPYLPTLPYLTLPCYPPSPPPPPATAAAIPYSTLPYPAGPPPPPPCCSHTLPYPTLLPAPSPTPLLQPYLTLPYPAPHSHPLLQRSGAQ
jgi:hypothetical protein